MAEARVLTGVEAELFKAVSDIVFSDSSGAVKANMFMQLIQSRDSEIERRAMERYTNRLIRAVRDGEIETITISLGKLRDELSGSSPADKERVSDATIDS